MIDEINGSNQLKDVRIERIMTTSLCTSRANYRPLQRAETQALRALTYENYPFKQKNVCSDFTNYSGRSTPTDQSESQPSM